MTEYLGKDGDEYKKFIDSCLNYCVTTLEKVKQQNDVFDIVSFRHLFFQIWSFPSQLGIPVEYLIKGPQILESKVCFLFAVL